jgi:organic radical activating enzyme
MSFDEIRSFVHLFDQADIHDIRWLGGEPTLHPAFDEIIAFAKANSKHSRFLPTDVYLKLLWQLWKTSLPMNGHYHEYECKDFSEQIRTREKNTDPAWRQSDFRIYNHTTCFFIR